MNEPLTTDPKNIGQEIGQRTADPGLSKYRATIGWWIFRRSVPQCTSQLQMLPKDRDAWYCCRRHEGHWGKHIAWTGERW